jgi:Uri superfamily endonuclease
MPQSTQATGSYVLWLRLDLERQITIGRLGSFYFPAGNYLYAGSAAGPGGVRARVLRHLRVEKCLHWHIDYLGAESLITHIAVCIHSSIQPAVKPKPMPVECRWSQLIARQPGAMIPAAGFGSSDCRSGCKAHLVCFPLTDS